MQVSLGGSNTHSTLTIPLLHSQHTPPPESSKPPSYLYNSAQTRDHQPLPYIDSAHLTSKSITGGLSEMFVHHVIKSNMFTLSKGSCFRYVPTHQAIYTCALLKDSPLSVEKSMVCNKACGYTPSISSSSSPCPALCKGVSGLSVARSGFKTH